jgi:uncharacterized protein YggE
MKIIFLVLVIAFSFQANASHEDIHTISVNGVAERGIDPNMAILQIEIWGRAATAKAAQEIQTSLHSKVKASIEKFRLKKEDVRTENYLISPEYVYDQKTSLNKIVGYKVSHQISAIYRKVDDVGNLVDALATNTKGDTGGVNIQNISWDSDKKANVESEALADAVKSARARAEELAKAAGVKIKSVHHIQNYTSTVNAPSVSGRVMSMKLESGGGAAPTELSSGQVKVYVSVLMDFEI